METGGQKCKLKMTDVVLFGEDGTLLRWLFTSKEGLIKRKSSASLKLPNVYKRFIHLGSDDPKNSKSIAAVAYLSDGEQVPVTGATLAEILLSGPRIGSLKEGRRNCCTPRIYPSKGRPRQWFSEYVQSKGQGLQKLHNRDPATATVG